MSKYFFSGEIPGSKSIFNRALIIQSFFPKLSLKGHSECDDVRHMRSGLRALLSGQEVDCGEGGTTLRFLSLRASRIPGRHILKGSPRLMQRPQSGLVKLLTDLGSKVSVFGDSIEIETQGWTDYAHGHLVIDSSESSQYASALILSAWNLDQDLKFQISGAKVSESYFQLTLKMLRDMGLEVIFSGGVYTVVRGQTPRSSCWIVEPDISSAFTIASAGALSGRVDIHNFPRHSTQPDIAFLDIFKKMNIDYELQNSCLSVRESPRICGLDWDLSQSPDLFPVLAVVCSWAQGCSKLFGAPHLIYKESNRIQSVAQLFDILAVQYEILSDGMIIHGNPHQTLKEGLRFNPDQDHRMVMAATLMKLKGHEIHIQNPEAINKSFPEFWSVIGVQP